MKKWWSVIVFVVGVFALAACASTLKTGTIIIETETRVDSIPVTGTFAVTKGADILGCAAGSFVDSRANDAVTREHTCLSGDNSGTFSIEFKPPGVGGNFMTSGPWVVNAGSEDFSSLSGEGKFGISFPEEGIANGVFTGEIEISN